jgi:hypothetical protein
MVRVQFIQALRIDGKVYSLGIHEIDESLFDHPHFDKYVKLGMIVDEDVKAVVKHESIQERSERLAAKLGVHKTAQAAIKKDEVPETEETEPVFESDKEAKKTSKRK